MVRLQIENHKVGGPLVFHPRTGRLLYVGREYEKNGKSRVSPLRLLIENANMCQLGKLKTNIRDSFLVEVENRKYKFTREHTRQMQKCLSLAYFKKLDATILKRPPPAPIFGEAPEQPRPEQPRPEQTRFSAEEDFIRNNQKDFRYFKRKLELHKVWSTIELADPFAKEPLFKPASVRW